MEERILEEEVVDSYFKKSGEELPAEEPEGSRELRPLPPFIVSGGRNTERFYFMHISNLTEYKFRIVPEYFGNESNYFEVFPERIKRIIDNDEDARVFCVFDWETVRDNETNERKHKTFMDLLKNSIDSGRIKICPSMPCFEYWLLLHFENVTTLFRSYSDVASRLAPYIKACFPRSGASLKKLLKREKYLLDSAWVKNLIGEGRLQNAISRAKGNIALALARGTLEEESYSYVYEVFES